MGHQKFNIEKLEKLNDPGRADTLKPDVMWEALDLKSPEVILEIGAGTGFFARRFAAMAPGAIVYASDIEPRMIEWMREHLEEVSAGTIVPLLSEETAVPVEDGIADIVVMINLHHELADPVATYAEANRVLHPGGRILVADWADRETPRGPSLAIRASTAHLRETLELAGFVDVGFHEGLPWHHLATATKVGS